MNRTQTSVVSDYILVEDEQGTSVVSEYICYFTVGEIFIRVELFQGFKAILPGLTGKI